MLDTTDAQLADRFDQLDIHSIHQLEKVLLSGSVDKVIEKYISRA